MKKHGLLMILCCALPLLLIALLTVGGIIGLLPLLLCVGMHLFMMKGLLHGKGCHGGHKNHEGDNTADPKAITGATEHSCYGDHETPPHSVKEQAQETS